jgi:hypothetical protein
MPEVIHQAVATAYAGRDVVHLTVLQSDPKIQSLTWSEGVHPDNFSFEDLRRPI